MNIGASCSCFYPLETEKALVRLGEIGIKTTEVFFNSFSELEEAFTKEINAIKSYYGMNIVSFHPFLCFAEGYNIFSSYKRRFSDSVELYKKFFEAAASVGAEYYVLHGAKDNLEISKEEYAERFFIFSKTAKQFGLTVCHENVVNYVGQSPEFMGFLKNSLGDDFKMVLDVKQARRAEADPYDFIKQVGESIVHLHLSDYSPVEDCLPASPNGCFDFKKLFSEVQRLCPCKNGIIEVYSRNFKSDIELSDSVNYLTGLLQIG